MKKPNKAILDGDIIVWKAAFVADAEGALSIDGLLGSLVNKWTPKGVKDIEIALSCPRKDNFRSQVFPGYKENRKDVYKPDSLSEVFEAIDSSYPCVRMAHLEADDILGLGASSGEAISVSIDKDLRGVPGWLYNPEKDKKPYLISTEDADRWFCTQWMTGDSTDGIPGLWRIGKKKAEKMLNEWGIEDWCAEIEEMYKEGKHVPKNKHEVEDICSVMAQCVRILRHGEYDIKKEKVKLWFPELGL